MDKPQLLVESFVVDLNNVEITEAVSKAVTTSKGVYLTLPVCKLNTETANGRIYGEADMRKAIESAQPAIKGRRLLCTSDEHPKDSHAPPIKASHLIEDAWISKGQLWNKWLILNTASGKDLKALVDARAALGVSIRGLGRVDEQKKVKDYNYLGTDGVGNPAAGIFALQGEGGVKVEVVESVDTDELVSEQTLVETTGLDIPGVGRINQNSTVNFRGGNYRVASIQGSASQYALQLVSELNGMTLVVYSNDVLNPSVELQVVKESTMSPKVTEWKKKISEAASQLRSIRKLGDVKGAMMHVAKFESELASSDLPGDELKLIQEEWDKAKIAKDETPNSLEDRIDVLSSQVSSIMNRIESVLNPSVTTESRTDVMREMLKSKWFFHDLDMSNVLSSFGTNKGNFDAFKNDLMSKMGTNRMIDWRTLYDDLMNVEGGTMDYDKASVLELQTAIEEGEEELSKAQDIIAEFLAKIDSKDLLTKEEVLETINVFVNDTKNTIISKEARERVALDMLAETITQAARFSKSLKESKRCISNIRDSYEIIINELRKSIVEREGKIVTESSQKEVIKGSGPSHGVKSPNNWL